MKKIIALTLALMLVLGAHAEVLSEKIAVIESLGIVFPETLENEIRADSGLDEEFMDYPVLLSWLGFGWYNSIREEFVPYGDDVFAFDAEMWDLSGDYIRLIEAVARISDGEVTVENCSAEITGVFREYGLGRQVIRFTMNGTERTFRAKIRSDWMDVGIIKYLNRCLEKDGSPRRVWCMYDMGQGFVVFCETQEWVENFEKATGYRLYLDADKAGEVF
ncbi:MAG: hypothetical protein IJO98_05515 [Clostridia bacterium]|nr:hypothetical protein [Clostridia bacterium]